MTLAERERDAIRKRCEEATPGPWRVKAHILVEQFKDGLWGLFVADCGMTDESRRNARFIAAARTDIPALLATLSAAEEQLAAKEAEYLTLVMAAEDWQARADSLSRDLAEARKALGEIAKGEGRYSMDRFEHACNTIEDMKAIANAALSKETDRG